MSFAVLCLGPKLCNLFLDPLLDAHLKLLAVAELEENLEPDENGGEEDGLDEVVEQGGSAALKGAVADELGDPADDVDDEGHLEGASRVLGAHVVGKGSGGDAKGGQDKAGDGLQEDIEGGVGEGEDGAEVQVQVGNGKPGRRLDQSAGIRGLADGEGLVSASKRVVPGQEEGTGWMEHVGGEKGRAYHAKGRHEDGGHADHVDGHVDRVVVIGAILLSRRGRVERKSSQSAKLSHRGRGTYEDEVSLEIERHVAGPPGGRSGTGSRQSEQTIGRAGSTTTTRLADGREGAPELCESLRGENGGELREGERVCVCVGEKMARERERAPSEKGERKRDGNMKYVEEEIWTKFWLQKSPFGGVRAGDEKVPMYEVPVMGYSYLIRVTWP